MLLTITTGSYFTLKNATKKNTASSNDVGSVFYFIDVSCAEMEMQKTASLWKKVPVFRNGKQAMEICFCLAAACKVDKLN